MAVPEGENREGEKEKVQLCGAFPGGIMAAAAA